MSFFIYKWLAVLHKIARKTLGCISLCLSSWRILFIIPLFLCVKVVILDFGQFCLAMGNNGSVANTIPNEGDCLVFCEWLSQDITSFIVSFLLCCGWNWWHNFVSKASALQLWNLRRIQAVKDNNIELNEINKKEPCVLVHVVKGYIFAMKVSSVTTRSNGDHQL